MQNCGKTIFFCGKKVFYFYIYNFFSGISQKSDFSSIDRVHNINYNFLESWREINKYLNNYFNLLMPGNYG